LWDSLNPILSLSEWIGDKSHSSKALKRDLNNDLPPLLQREPDKLTAKVGFNEARNGDSFVRVHHRSFSTFSSRWKGNQIQAQAQLDDLAASPKDRRSSAETSDVDVGALYFILNESRKRKRDEDVASLDLDSKRYNARPFIQRKRQDGGVPGTVDIMVRAY